MMSIMTIPAPHPATRPRLQQGVGVGRAGTRAGLRRGRWAPLAPTSGVAICPQGPREPVSLTGTQAWSPVPLGASSVPTAAQASGWGLWRSRGSSGRAGLLLPAAGPASTPLPRVGPEQGGQGAIGWGASALHLEVGSQGGVLARAPLRGGLGIWKESRRVGSRRASGAREAPSLPVPPAREALCPVRVGQSGCQPLVLMHSFPHSFIHPLIHSSIHPLIHSFTLPFIHSFTHSSIHSFSHSLIYLFTIYSFIHSSNNADQGQVPGTAEVPGRDIDAPPHKGTEGSVEHREKTGGWLPRGRDPRAGPEAGAGVQEEEGPVSAEV